MKKILLSMAIAIMSFAANAQGVFGKWLTEEGDAQVEIYEKDGKVHGKVVWLQQGPDTKDSKNPDAKLRGRKLMGVDLLSGLTKKGDKYEGGKVYDPKSGKSYKCAIWLDGNDLKVRGYLGIFRETQTWKRK
jgi:uncharacterized protein (DUF2147 family)